MDPLGMTPLALEEWAVSESLPRYRGRQIFDLVHRRLAADYAAARELPAALRERLASELPIARPEILRRDRAADGSVKLGLRLSDGALIEAVYMPGEARESLANEFTDARAVSPASPESSLSPKSKIQNPKFTVCLSSQTGCA